MENKSRAKKHLTFLFIIFIICIVVFFGYYLISGKKNPLFEAFENINKKEEIKDNYNGIYTYDDLLNGSKAIFNGCSLNKISNHILVIDDKYYLYRSSCMGTYLKGYGETKDLEFQVNEDKKIYETKLDGKTFLKDFSVSGIVLNNRISELLTSVSLASYQLFMQETQFPGNYYNILDAKMENVSSKIRMNIKRNEIDNSFTISFTNNRFGLILYSYRATDLSMLPDMYPYGESVVVIEKGKNKKVPSRYSYKFRVINPEGTIYNLDNEFPIDVDETTLSIDNSIYVFFDPANRYFRMLVGFDDKFCTDNYTELNKNDISYYEFKIEYNYRNNSFDTPEFVKMGYKGDGCRYINNLMGGK